MFFSRLSADRRRENNHVVNAYFSSLTTGSADIAVRPATVTFFGPLRGSPRGITSTRQGVPPALACETPVIAPVTSSSAKGLKQWVNWKRCSRLRKATVSLVFKGDNSFDRFGDRFAYVTVWGVTGTVLLPWWALCKTPWAGVWRGANLSPACLASCKTTHFRRNVAFRAVASCSQTQPVEIVNDYIL